MPKIRSEAFAPGEQIHPIADRRWVVRALTPWPLFLRGVCRSAMRLAEIGKIRAHQPLVLRRATLLEAACGSLEPVGGLLQ
jgi:hypothetical protein